MEDFSRLFGNSKLVPPYSQIKGEVVTHLVKISKLYITGGIEEKPAILKLYITGGIEEKPAIFKLYITGGIRREASNIKTVSNWWNRREASKSS